MVIQNSTATQKEKYDTKQVFNGMGGAVYLATDMDNLRRFLILGSEKAQYAAGRNESLKVDDCPAVIRLLEKDGISVVNELIEISESGRAPKQDATLFVLALAARSGDVTTRKAATGAIERICRTPTMLFSFLDFYKSVGKTGGWGRLMRESVADWYNSKPLPDLVYQVTKYAQREGWSHRDVLRLSHPTPTDEDRSAFYKWIVSSGAAKVDLNKSIDKGAMNKLAAIEAAKLAPHSSDIIPLIREYGLVHEHVPKNLQKDPAVWEALLDKMPLTALLRNLGRMTSYGLLTEYSGATVTVIAKLTNEKAIEKARIHPFNVLVAYNTYSSGKGQRGSLAWSPVKRILRALNDLFYMTFTYVEPCNKRINLALDVSGSMDMGEILGSPGMKPRLGAGALAMTFLRSEKNVAVKAFSTTMVDCPLTADNDLETVCKKMRKIPMGATDCAAPIVAALKNKEEYDAFVVITDSDTYAGKIHPMAALREYRQKMKINAKLIVIAMNSRGFTIADPGDNGSLDIVGFDSVSPAVVSEFCRGSI